MAVSGKSILLSKKSKGVCRSSYGACALIAYLNGAGKQPVDSPWTLRQTKKNLGDSYLCVVASARKRILGKGSIARHERIV